MSRLFAITVAGLVGFLATLIAAVAVEKSRPDPRPPAESRPLPHHVAKYPGGLSFRFAMVNDVLTERYPRHGKAHYEARNAVTRAKLAKLAADDPATFPLTDDLAAGLARLGKLNEAADLLREKLTRQQAKGLTGKDLYSTYANLGAILFHARMGAARSGEAVARAEFAEGVEFVRKAVEVNPEAHFGREQWQVAYAEFQRAAMDKPALLREFDFIGNRLDTMDQGRWPSRAYRFAGDAYSVVMPHYLDELAGADLVSANTRKILREYVARVGAEDGWKDVPVPAIREPVPFDEPCLGIVGMWRQGIGADPHFALCLGETMLRVGQRFLAWAAFERASRLAGAFSADPATQAFLRDHCQKRQAKIEEGLSATDRDGLRPRFDAELAHGEKFQREYQDYEAAKLAAGVPVDDPHFFDAFFPGRPPIASPSGPEEWHVTEARTWRDSRGLTSAAWGLFGAGFAMMATALVLRRFPKTQL